MIPIQCDTCGRVGEVSDSLRGKAVSCKCGCVITVHDAAKTDRVPVQAPLPVPITVPAGNPKAKRDSDFNTFLRAAEWFTMSIGVYGILVVIGSIVMIVITLKQQEMDPEKISFLVVWLMTGLIGVSIYAARVWLMSFSTLLVRIVRALEEKQ